MTRRRAKPKIRRGEELLSEIESISIRLEGGKVAKLSVADELAVSDDPEELYHQALTAHSRYAFWAYQAERALAQLRAAEAEFAKEEGNKRYGYSRAAKEQDRYTASATIDGLVASDPKLEKLRKGLIDLRTHWTILRSVADALDHRAHLLRRLIAKDQDATRGK